MSMGTVKWFNAQKGYGFITPDDGAVDAFVHIRALEDAGIYTLMEGQRVSYDLHVDHKTGKTKAGHLAIIQSDGRRGSAPNSRKEWAGGTLGSKLR